MVVSRALKTNDLKVGVSKLLNGLHVNDKNIIALMTPHFQNDEIQESLKSLSKYSVVGGIVDGIQGYTGPCISLTSIEKGSPFVIPDGVFQARDKAVGRWASMHKDMNRMRSGGFDGAQDFIKPSLEQLASRWLPNITDQAQTFVFLSEKSSLHEFCQMLDTIYPNSSKIGIQTSPMIFKTGHPSCLFGNSQILHGGVVGYALPSENKVMMEFSDLIPFSEQLTISECKGNVLLNWEGPEVSFNDLKDALYIKLLDFEMNAVFQVIGGDPSRKSVLLDTEIELKKGMNFKFMIKDKSATLSRPHNSLISFSVNNILGEDNVNKGDSFDHRDDLLSVVSVEGAIVGGSGGPCVISSINNSVVHF